MKGPPARSGTPAIGTGLWQGPDPVLAEQADADGKQEQGRIKAAGTHTELVATHPCTPSWPPPSYLASADTPAAWPEALGLRRPAVVPDGPEPEPAVPQTDPPVVEPRDPADSEG
jgi:hypothetical protein